MTDMISALLALFYGIMYCFTIAKIWRTNHLVSTVSFAGFATVNLGLAIANGANYGSLGYATAFVMGTITVISNEIVRKKLKAGKAVPKL